jgi:hypothetical protein
MNRKFKYWQISWEIYIIWYSQVAVELEVLRHLMALNLLYLCPWPTAHTTNHNKLSLS